MKHVRPLGLCCWGSSFLELITNNLRDSSLCSSSFRRGLKLNFSRDTSVFSAIEMHHDIALYKFSIDIDTYTLSGGLLNPIHSLTRTPWVEGSSCSPLRLTDGLVIHSAWAKPSFILSSCSSHCCSGAVSAADCD